MVIKKTEWLRTESERWRSELNGCWWRGPWEGGWRIATPSCLWRSDRLQEHLRRWHVLLVDWSVSWIEVSLHLPCTLPIKISTSPSFFLLCAETSLSERVRHLSEPNRSHPSATRSTRSLLSSVSDPIRSSRCYTFDFYDRHGRSIKFLASVSSLFFILNRQS